LRERERIAAGDAPPDFDLETWFEEDNQRVDQGREGFGELAFIHLAPERGMKGLTQKGIRRFLAQPREKRVADLTEEARSLGLGDAVLEAVIAEMDLQAMAFREAMRRDR